MKPRSDTLFLHEEVLLLALRDKEGTIAAGSTYQFAIGGALLAELLFRDRVRLDQTSKKRLVEIVDVKSIGEELLDECLAAVENAKRRATSQTWVEKFARVKRLKYRLAGQLRERGIVTRNEDKILGIFTRTTYPEADPGPERRLIDRLSKAILLDSDSVDPRTVVLLSLAFYAGLLNGVVGKKELKARKARIKQIIEGDVTGTAVKEAIEAMHAAVAVAAMVT